MRSRRAFTLIELLVSIGVLALMGFALAAILRSALSAWQEGEGRSETSAVARAALDQVCEDLGSAFTKAIQPPGPITVAVPTAQDLYLRGVEAFSDEWCGIQWTLDGLGWGAQNAWLTGGRGAMATFRFRLGFPAATARAWLATAGDVLLEAKICTEDNVDNDAAGWVTLAERAAADWSGDLSPLIKEAAPEGATEIRLRATIPHDVPDSDAERPRILPGIEGPVLRFSAEPQQQAVAGPIRFLLSLQMDQPQAAVFVRDFGQRPDSLEQASNSASSLGEVCYVTTFDEIERDDGTREPLPAGTIWRAVKRPLGNWAGETGEAGESFFDREFVHDRAKLRDAVMAEEGTTGRWHVQRQKMEALGFHPIAENVLYFGIQAWSDEGEWSDWLDGWAESRGIPRKVRVVLCLQPQTSRRTIARLSEQIGDTGTVVLDSARGFDYYVENSALQRFVKIDREWLYYDNIIEGRKLVFETRQDTPYRLDADRPPSNMGLRGTVVREHAIGADVYRGDTYVRTVTLPYPKSFEQGPAAEEP